jgi:endonuclease/exonuclease/phosphatase family metal-dependent hydrolase
LDADVLAIQEVDRQLARSDRTHQAHAIAEALGHDCWWFYAAALVGYDFQPLPGLNPARAGLRHAATVAPAAG